VGLVAGTVDVKDTVSPLVPVDWHTTNGHTAGGGGRIGTALDIVEDVEPHTSHEDGTSALHHGARVVDGDVELQHGASVRCPVGDDAVTGASRRLHVAGHRSVLHPVVERADGDDRPLVSAGGTEADLLADGEAELGRHGRLLTCAAHCGADFGGKSAAFFASRGHGGHGDHEHRHEGAEDAGHF